MTSDRGDPTGSFRDFADACLTRRVLVRKSFEYRNAKFDALETAGRAATLGPILHPKVSEKTTALDSYWSREHALARLVRDDQKMSYLEYLPGRVYTYRALLRRILKSIDLTSLTEVGCGSCMLLHEAAVSGIEDLVGIDISLAALSFAYYLASEFQTKNLCLINCDALGEWLPPIKRADLVSNLGSLEHMALGAQLKFATFMGQLSKNYVLLSVPNKASQLFQVMESTELSIMELEWVYPDETAQHPVDFKVIGDALGWKLLQESSVHVASTSVTEDCSDISKYLAEVRVKTPEINLSQNDLINHWVAAESCINDEDIDKAGWFKFALFQI